MRTFDARVDSVLGHKGLPNGPKDTTGDDEGTVPPTPSAGRPEIARRYSAYQPGDASPKVHTASPERNEPRSVLAHMRDRTGDVKTSIAESQHAASVLRGTEAARQRYMQYGKEPRAPPSSRTEPAADDHWTGNASATTRLYAKPDKSTPPAQGRGEKFVAAGGGLPLLITMPILIFLVSLVMLYATAPAFVCRDPRTEYELAQVDHLRVVLIAVGAGVATAAASVVWTAAKVGKKET